MSKSSLAIDHAELQARVAYLLHGVRSTANLSSDETDNIASIIKSGLRKFYYPHIVDPNIRHIWSFLRVRLTLPLSSNVNEYELPDDFGGMTGEMHFKLEDQGYREVVKVNDNKILRLRSRNLSVSSFPMYYAERPEKATGTLGQKWILMVWPDPDGNYTLNGRYWVHPQALTSSLDVPYGGLEHSETILEACLAAAEQQIDGQQGIHTRAFERALQASIQYDQMSHRPDTLGVDTPYSNAGDEGIRPDGRYENYNVITYGNTQYTGS